MSIIWGVTSLSLALQRDQAIRYNLPKKTGGFSLLSFTRYIIS
jgi:hypothetical protein